MIPSSISLLSLALLGPFFLLCTAGPAEKGLSEGWYYDKSDNVLIRRIQRPGKVWFQANLELGGT